MPRDLDTAAEAAELPPDLARARIALTRLYHAAIREAIKAEEEEERQRANECPGGQANQPGQKPEKWRPTTCIGNIIAPPK